MLYGVSWLNKRVECVSSRLYLYVDNLTKKPKNGQWTLFRPLHIILLNTCLLLLILRYFNKDNYKNNIFFLKSIKMSLSIGIVKCHSNFPPICQSCSKFIPAQQYCYYVRRHLRSKPIFLSLILLNEKKN